MNGLNRIVVLNKIAFDRQGFRPALFKVDRRNVRIVERGAVAEGRQILRDLIGGQRSGDKVNVVVLVVQHIECRAVCGAAFLDRNGFDVEILEQIGRNGRGFRRKDYIFRCGRNKQNFPLRVVEDVVFRMEGGVAFLHADLFDIAVCKHIRVDPMHVCGDDELGDGGGDIEKFRICRVQYAAALFEVRATLFNIYGFDGRTDQQSRIDRSRICGDGKFGHCRRDQQQRPVCGIQRAESRMICGVALFHGNRLKLCAFTQQRNDRFRCERCGDLIFGDVVRHEVNLRDFAVVQHAVDQGERGVSARKSDVFKVYASAEGIFGDHRHRCGNRDLRKAAAVSEDVGGEFGQSLAQSYRFQQRAVIECIAAEPRDRAGNGDLRERRSCKCGIFNARDRSGKLNGLQPGIFEGRNADRNAEASFAERDASERRQTLEQAAVIGSRRAARLRFARDFGQARGKRNGFKRGASVEGVHGQGADLRVIRKNNVFQAGAIGKQHRSDRIQRSGQGNRFQSGAAGENRIADARKPFRKGNARERGAVAESKLSERTQSGGQGYIFDERSFEGAFADGSESAVVAERERSEQGTAECIVSDRRRARRQVERFDCRAAERVIADNEHRIAFADRHFGERGAVAECIRFDIADRSGNGNAFKRSIVGECACGNGYCSVRYGISRICPRGQVIQQCLPVRREKHAVFGRIRLISFRHVERSKRVAVVEHRAVKIVERSGKRERYDGAVHERVGADARHAVGQDKVGKALFGIGFRDNAAVRKRSVFDRRKGAAGGELDFRNIPAAAECIAADHLCLRMYGNLAALCGRAEDQAGIVGGIEHASVRGVIAASFFNRDGFERVGEYVRTVREGGDRRSARRKGSKRLGQGDLRHGRAIGESESAFAQRYFARAAFREGKFRQRRTAERFVADGNHVRIVQACGKFDLLQIAVFECFRTDGRQPAVFRECDLRRRIVIIECLIAQHSQPCREVDLFDQRAAEYVTRIAAVRRAEYERRFAVFKGNRGEVVAVFEGACTDARNACGDGDGFDLPSRKCERADRFERRVSGEGKCYRTARVSAFEGVVADALYARGNGKAAVISGAGKGIVADFRRAAEVDVCQIRRTGYFRKGIVADNDVSVCGQVHGCDSGIVEGIIADGQSLCPAGFKVKFGEISFGKRIASDRRDRAGDGDLFKIVIAVEYVVRDDFNAVAHRIFGRFALINEQGFVGVLTVRALQINRVAVGGKGRVALFHGNIDVFIQAEQEAGGYDRIFRYGQRREPAP